MDRLLKPTPQEAKELGRLFSSTSTTSKRGPVFDPSQELIGLPDRKKKRRASTSKGRSVNITVCRLKKFTSFIPKGRVRTLLKEEGRVVTVQLTRSMSPSTVKQCITRAFRNLSGEWQYLETGQENRLQIVGTQLDGNAVCSRRGCLYILDKVS